MGKVLAFQPAAQRRAQEEITARTFGVRRIARSMFLTPVVTAVVSSAFGVFLVAVFGG